MDRIVEFTMKSRWYLVVALVLAVYPLEGADKAPVVGESAKDFELAALNGGKVKLKDVIDGGPVVLVVLRGYPGYQCPLCTNQCADFLTKADDFKSAGAKVLFVYPGPSSRLKAHADEFVSGKDYPDHMRILLDPDYVFTKLYGLRWDAKGETAYPSTFVINTDRKILFASVSKDHGGRTRARDALKALSSK